MNINLGEFHALKRPGQLFNISEKEQLLEQLLVNDPVKDIEDEKLIL
jgi:hypothetical protein